MFQVWARLASERFARMASPVVVTMCLVAFSHVPTLAAMTAAAVRAAEAAPRVGVRGARPAPAALAGVAEPPPRRRADDAVAALVDSNVARVAVDERARVRAAAADGADLAV